MGQCCYRLTYKYPKETTKYRPNKLISEINELQPQ